MARRLMLACVMLLLNCALINASFGADLGASSAPPAAYSSDVSEYLERRAVLHQLRAMFDVVQPEDVPLLVQDDLRRATRFGVTQDDVETLRVELLTEGSFLITQLRYLVEVGGAVWPSDRPEDHYAADALVRLSAIARDFVGAIEAGADPLPLMQQADEIYWQTEGYADVPPGQGHFVGRDELIQDAAGSAAERAST